MEGINSSSDKYKLQRVICLAIPGVVQKDVHGIEMFKNLKFMLPHQTTECVPVSLIQTFSARRFTNHGLPTSVMVCSHFPNRYMFSYRHCGWSIVFSNNDMIGDNW